MKEEWNTVYYIIKIGDKYFEDAFEDLYCEDDELNYSFTDDVKNAYQFFGDIDKDDSAPKYLWDEDNGVNIKTARQACDFLNGELIKVTKTITTTYQFDKTE